MRLGTTYISVNDFAKSLAFYQLLLEQEPLYCNDDRWATFDCGNSLSLYNRQFDIDFLVNNDYRGHYNHSYLTTLKNENSDKINTSVIFNFEVEDLISEYERIKKLNCYLSISICHTGILQSKIQMVMKLKLLAIIMEATS